MKLSRQIDKFGTIGLFVTAIFSPCCFPLFAFAASALGLGSAELFGGYTMWIFQGMVALLIIGLIISYRTHRSVFPLIFSFLAAALIIYGYHFEDHDYWIYFLYSGMAFAFAASLYNYLLTRKKMVIVYESVITCPECGHSKKETMPSDACQFFYECESCKTRLKPKAGDCCVYCSYGTVKCPPIQSGNSCC
jgi:hypothetical protein